MRKSSRVFIMVMFLSFTSSLVHAQSCSACGYNGSIPQCYSVPTGISGNTGCANNYYGGCTYWGVACSNGQQGPPTQSDYCTFNPSDSACQRGPVQNPMACMPSLKNELLGYTPLPGWSIRLVRTSDGRLVRFEHTL
jgi:hypothetical protein